MLSYLLGLIGYGKDAPQETIEAVLPEPCRIVIRDGARDTLARYQRLEAQTGHKSAEIRYEELKLFLADNDMLVYNLAQVHGYMMARAFSVEAEYYWWQFRKKDGDFKFCCHFVDKRKRLGYYTPWSYGRYANSLYNKAIPLKQMELIAKISEKFPDACFCVALVDHTGIPDVFLAVGIPHTDLLVISFWDKPGFDPSIANAFADLGQR